MRRSAGWRPLISAWGCAAWLLVFQPARSQIDAPAPPLELPPAPSFKHCIGRNQWSRTCQFTNIVYDKKEQTWVFHGRDMERAIEEGVRLQDTKYIQLGLRRHYTARFTISFIDKMIPPLSTLCVYDTPSYLHYPLYPESFGHNLRDTYNIMSGNLFQLGLEARDYRLLIAYTNVSEVLQHYHSYVATSVATWRDEIDKCSQRYVLFKELVAGYGARDLRHTTTAHVGHESEESCEPAYFNAMRSRAYRLGNLDIKDAQFLPRHRILLLDRLPGDRRRIANLADVLPVLQAQFPTCEVLALTLRSMSAQEQLRFLSDTSILVTTGGSASYRLIYLPTNAHVVFVGAAETEPQWAPLAFHEVDECWRYLPYLKVDRYHVTEQNDTVPLALDPERGTDAAFHAWFDADVRIDAVKLGAVIQLALNDIQNPTYQAAE